MTQLKVLKLKSMQVSTHEPRHSAKVYSVRPITPGLDMAELAHPRSHCSRNVITYMDNVLEGSGPGKVAGFNHQKENLLMA